MISNQNRVKSFRTGCPRAQTELFLCSSKSDGVNVGIYGIGLFNRIDLKWLIDKENLCVGGNFLSLLETLFTSNWTGHVGSLIGKS